MEYQIEERFPDSRVDGSESRTLSILPLIPSRYHVEMTLDR